MPKPATGNSRLDEDEVVRDFVLDGAVLLIAQHPVPAADDLLGRAAARILTTLPSAVSVLRSCRECGSSDHGQPHVVTSGPTAGPCSVSFSRTDGYAIAAARPGSRIGVDIESVAQVSMHPVDTVLLHPHEAVTFESLNGEAARRYLAQLWVAKEAVLKLTGDGLRIDLRLLHVRLDGEVGYVESWPRGIDLAESPRVSFFDVSEDVVGALAASE